MAYKLNVLISVLKFSLLFGLTCDFYRLISFPKRGTEVNDGDAGIRYILSKIVSVSIPLVIFLGSPADQVHRSRGGVRGPMVFSGHPFRETVSFTHCGGVE